MTKPVANVSSPERLASVIGGGALMMYGLQRRSWAGWGLAALGGALVARGATGRCQMYQALGVNTASLGKKHNISVAYATGVHVDHTIVIHKSPAEVYRFWRNLENLPRFMQHLASVVEMDNRHSHWVAKAPAGRLVEWQAEIINDIEDKLIGWRSLPDSDIHHAGSVHFRPTLDGAATELTVTMQYNPPGGRVGAWVAKLFGEEPAQQIAEDLSRLKELLETGAVPDKEVLTNEHIRARTRGWNRDWVHNSSEESFPASDPPSWTPEALPH